MSAQAGDSLSLSDNAQLKVEYFYVAVDQQHVGYRVLGWPVSPNFRTEEEAKAFQASYEIEGVYCLSGGFFPRDAEAAKQIDEMLFGSETQAAMTDPICYQVVKNEQAQKNPELYFN